LCIVRQVLTIRGNTFSEDTRQVSVTVGGTRCDVISASLHTITCRLAARSEDAVVPAWQQGSRGVSFKYFTGRTSPGQHDEAYSVTKNPPFLQEIGQDFFDARRNMGSYYTGEHEAFFLVPRTATYYFLVSGDDNTYVRAVVAR